MQSPFTIIPASTVLSITIEARDEPLEMVSPLTLPSLARGEGSVPLVSAEGYSACLELSELSGCTPQHSIGVMQVLFMPG